MILLAAYLVAGNGLGATALPKRSLALVGNAVSPEWTAHNTVLKSYVADGASPLRNWLVVEVVGVILGGFLGALSAGRLATKVEKALTVDGPAFLNVLMPCTIGWHFDPAIGMQICKEAVENNFWPLFEVENGKYKINYKPSEKKPKTPLADWMKQQGRFKHLFKPGNEELLVKCQEYVDLEWEKLLKLEVMTAEPESVKTV